MEPGFFRRTIYPRIQAVLERAEVRVAHLAKSDDVLCGFVVLEPGVVHMVYVRPPWRRMGMAKALLHDVELSECDWSTQSGEFREWIRFKYPMRHYRPFWAL